MADNETLREHQTLADDLNALAHARLESATPVEVLSTRGDKVLQVLQESDGSKIVTRSFTDDAVSHVERHGLDFVEAWEAMHAIFSGDEMGVVRSSLLRSSGDYPFVAVSEYLKDSKDVVEAPTEFKVRLARSLGGLLRADSGHFPALEMVREDMFRIVERDGQQKALLIDTDPHIMAGGLLGSDIISAKFVTTLGEFFFDKWCTESERQEVLGALVRSVADIALDDFGFSTQMLTAFSNIHMMCQGLDPRELGLFQ